MHADGADICIAKHCQTSQTFSGTSEAFCCDGGSQSTNAGNAEISVLLDSNFDIQEYQEKCWKCCLLIASVSAFSRTEVSLRCD